MENAYERLSPDELEVLEALLISPTLAEAAQACGKSTRTLRRWLSDPRFRSALQQARVETIRGVVVELERVAVKAVRALEGILDDANAPAPSRVSAARVVLETLWKSSSHGETEPEATEQLNDTELHAKLDPRAVDDEFLARMRSIGWAPIEGRS